MNSIDDVLTTSAIKKILFYKNPLVKKVRAWLFLNRYFNNPKYPNKKKEERRNFLALRDEAAAYDIGIFAPHCLQDQNKEMEEIVKAECNGYSHRYFVLHGGGEISPLLIKHGKPRYAIGIACNFELEMGDLLIYNVGLRPFVLDIPKQCGGKREESYVEYFRNGFSRFLDYVKDRDANNGKKTFK